MNYDKFRLISSGVYPYMELDGKGLGTGVTGISFEQNETSHPSLTLKLDLEDFRFEEEGWFNKKMEQMAEIMSNNIV